MLGAEQCAEYVGLEDRCILLRRNLGERCGATFSARIVHHNVHPAEAGQGLREEGADFGFTADIGLEEYGFGAACVQFGDQRLTLRSTAAGDNQAGALLGVSEGCGAADTAQRARDEHNRGRHGRYSLSICSGASGRREVGEPGRSIRQDQPAGR